MERPSARTSRMYMLTNKHLNDTFNTTWVRFATAPDGLGGKWMEVSYYVEGKFHGQARGGNRYGLYDVIRARELWNFWLEKGFERITDPTDKGWKYTEEMVKSFKERNTVDDQKSTRNVTTKTYTTKQMKAM